MKPITIVWEIHDIGRSYRIFEKGYLMDHKSAMYLNQNGSICIVNVIPTDNPDYYLEDSISIDLTDEHAEISEEECYEIRKKLYEMLTKMDAWTFIRDILCHAGFEIVFSLI